jgi:hypothetical protein
MKKKRKKGTYRIYHSMTVFVLPPVKGFSQAHGIIALERVSYPYYDNSFARVFMQEATELLLQDVHSQVT